MSIDFRDKMTPQQKIERTRSILMRNHPFYATVACNIGWKIREDLPHPTAATDGLNVYWHPEFVNQCNDAEMEAVAIHEIHHVIKRHAFRKKRRDHELWNAACDYQINPELVEQGLKLPPKCLLDAKYKGMLEEHIYDDLLAKSNDGKGRPKFDPSSGYVMEPAEGTDAGMAERHLDGVIEQAAKIARDAGKLPGFLNDFVFENRKAQVNWRARLRNIIEPLFPRDITWSNPNRRLLSQKLFVPGPRFDGTAEIAVLIDTSGSVSDNEVITLINELNAIISGVSPSKLQVHWFESYVWQSDLLTQGMLLRIPDKIQRGGTSFERAFEAIKGNPRVVICLTDMDDSFDFKRPKGRTIWVSTTECKAPWGETIHLKV